VEDVTGAGIKAMVWTSSKGGGAAGSYKGRLECEDKGLETQHNLRNQDSMQKKKRISNPVTQTTRKLTKTKTI